MMPVKNAFAFAQRPPGCYWFIEAGIPVGEVSYVTIAPGCAAPPLHPCLPAHMAGPLAGRPG